MSRVFTIETRAGQPIHAGGRTLILFARSLRIRFPRLSGGLVWNGPASVLVQSTDGQEEILPVHDVTRRFQLCLIVLSLSTLLITTIISSKHNTAKE